MSLTLSAAARARHMNLIKIDQDGSPRAAHEKDERPPTAKASRNSAPVQAIVDDEFSPAWVARHANASDADIYDPSVGEFQ